MNHAWCPIAQRLVRPLLIVEPQPATDTPTRFGHRTIRLDVHLLIFQAAPQPLDEDVVQKSAFPVHADPDALARKRIQKCSAGELHTLIVFEYVRTTMPCQCVPQCRHTEVRLQGERKPPRQPPPA